MEPTRTLRRLADVKCVVSVLLILALFNVERRRQNRLMQIEAIQATQQAAFDQKMKFRSAQVSEVEYPEASLKLAREDGYLNANRVSVSDESILEMHLILIAAYTAFVGLNFFETLSTLRHAKTQATEPGVASAGPTSPI